MGTTLVIVESPTKARTLKKFLGKGYCVKASVGHLIDLPKSKLGVDIENGFKPHYITIRGKGKLLKELKLEAGKAQRVLLATDPDREGEAISWHLSQALKVTNTNQCRVLIPEFTKGVVDLAVKNPEPLDLSKVNSQQARRILDRLVGYKISPLLWRKLQWGLSAGRVQSVALKLIVDREREVRAFTSEEYWTLGMTFAAGDLGDRGFEADLKKIAGADVKVGSKAEMDAILAELRTIDYAISAIDRTTRNQKPAAPYITSTLQQVASRRFNFSTRKTMIIAQQLYEGIDLGKRGPIGLITYMRTDSTRVSTKAQAECSDFIKGGFGAEYAPDKAPEYIRGKKGGNVQDAHEAIRPTDVTLEPKDIKKFLSTDQYKLYALVWTRFVASQNKSAVFHQTRIDVTAGSYLFRAIGRQLHFEGYLRTFRDYPELATKFTDSFLPQIDKTDALKVSEEKPEQHFTQPPPKYTEASLVKSLEENGIGRPSTYSAIISTMLDRKYVGRREKNLEPTELGITVVELLEEHFKNIMSIEFTAQMEQKLDGIENGDHSWQGVLEEFYGDFKVTLEEAEKSMRNLKQEVVETDIKCPECSMVMVIKRGRYGKFLACSGYPKCKHTSELSKESDETGAAQPKKKAVMLDEKCEKCSAQMQMRTGRYGRFKACSNYPTCKNTAPLLNKLGVGCPLDGCDGEIVSRFTRRKKMFYGCSKYPNCKFTSWVRPAKGSCPMCGKYLVERRSKNLLEAIICSDKACPYQTKPPADAEGVEQVAAKGAEQVAAKSADPVAAKPEV